MADGEAARRRLHDLIRLRLDGCRVLGIAEERALLERALELPGMSLRRVRAALLDRALACGVLLESRERQRVADFIVGRARRGRIDRRTVRDAGLLALPLLFARRRGEDAVEYVVGVAERCGIRACTGFALPGPPWWSEAMTRYRSARTPGRRLQGWQAVR